MGKRNNPLGDMVFLLVLFYSPHLAPMRDNHPYIGDETADWKPILSVTSLRFWLYPKSRFPICKGFNPLSASTTLAAVVPPAPAAFTRAVAFSGFFSCPTFQHRLSG